MKCVTVIVLVISIVSTTVALELISWLNKCVNVYKLKQLNNKLTKDQWGYQ